MKHYSMNDHDNALMLCSHWATSESDRLAISHFAARISCNEKPDASDAAAFERVMAEWERNAKVSFFVELDEQRMEYASLKDAKTAHPDKPVKWVQRWIKTETA